MPTLYVSNPHEPKASMPKTTRSAKKAKHSSHKARRSPAQKAATKRMIAASRSGRRAAPRRRRAARRSSSTAMTTTRSAAPRKSNPPRRRRTSRSRRRNASRALAAPRRRRARRSRSIRNPLTISNPLSRIPVIGPAIAMIGPAFFGAIGIEAIGQLHVIASKMGIEVPEAVLPFTYTIGGLLIAGLIQMFTFLPPSVRYSLGLATASAGGAVDMYRYRESKGAYGALELGDGGEWTVEVDPGNQKEMGALELGALELGALELGDFSGDAEHCGKDFSMAEGKCLADEGYGAFHRRFIRPLGPDAHKHPDKRRNVEGIRWMWLAQRISPAGMKELANLKPGERLHYIAQAKAAIASSGIQPVQRKPPLQIVEGIRNNNLPKAFETDWSHGWGPTTASSF